VEFAHVTIIDSLDRRPVSYSDRAGGLKLALGGTLTVEPPGVGARCIRSIRRRWIRGSPSRHSSSSSLTWPSALGTDTAPATTARRLDLHRATAAAAW
jgi:hypothetical protein